MTNPATGEMLARVPLSTAADLDAAVRAARAALPAWRAVSVIERGRRLFALREGLDARREELARSVTTEMGKTLVDARAEVGADDRDGRGRLRDPDDDAGPDPRGRLARHRRRDVRQPVGVCAAIVPFNFPAMVPFWFLPFAIGCGNAFILKPSEQVPLTQQIAFEVLDELELPPGVVNLVNGGREVVEGILDHPGIDAVSFVGSAPVARLVYERAAKAGKRVQALGGAKNHMVVMPDAVIDKTVTAHRLGLRRGGPALHGGLGRRHGRRRARRADAAAARGRPRRSGRRRPRGAIDVGPVISERRASASVGAIERAREEGAQLVVDGRGPGGAGGAFVGPTILDRRRARDGGRARGDLRPGAVADPPRRHARAGTRRASCREAVPSSTGDRFIGAWA